jgi:GNAT superfamily N-acetyltransferase
MNDARRITTAIVTVVLGVALAGCGPSTNLVKPCCYKGDVALTHLADTRLALASGATVPFGDVFSGFTADPATFGRVFPFEKADIGLVTFASLRGVLPEYDANGDRILEQPELTALYVQEAARGLGYPVVGIDPSGSNGAIVTSRADMSALVRFVERHVHEMAQPQQKIFRDLYWLGLEVDTLPHFFDDELDGLGI